MRRTIVTSVALAAVLAFTAAACGDDDDDGGAAEATSAPAAEGTSAPAGGADTTAAAGEETEVTTGELIPVRLQLQWVTQAQFAGYFAAIDQGYYTDAGLDVQILEGGVDIVPQTVLAQGGADFAIAWVPKALQSREQGAEITDIAQIFQRSGTLQVSWADSGITTPEDFAGKNIGNWGFGNEFELFAGMTQAGLDPATDVSLVQQNFDMLALLNRDIDAAQAMTYNEYAQVLEAVNPDTGELYQPEDFAVIDWNDVGTAMLQDAIWADTGRLESDEEYAATAEAFVKASLEGWIYCRDNPQECADLVVAQGSQLGASHQLWQMNEINKLIWPSPAGIGVIDPAAWDQTVTIALETKNAEGSTVITAEPEGLAYTNDIVESALTTLTEAGVDVTGDGFEPVEVELLEGGA